MAGWYAYIDRQHYISTAKHLLLASSEQVVVYVEIDPTTAKVLTGKKDKHGVEIGGSMGELTGGDNLLWSIGGEKITRIASWSPHYLSWMAVDGSHATGLVHILNRNIEIIPKEGE